MPGGRRSPAPVDKAPGEGSKDSAPLLNTTIFTGSSCWRSVPAGTGRLDPARPAAQCPAPAQDAITVSMDLGCYVPFMGVIRCRR